MRDALQVALAAERDCDQSAAGDALDLHLVELGLQLLHLGLQLRGLLHQAQKSAIGHKPRVRCLSRCSSSRTQLSPKPSSSVRRHIVVGSARLQPSPPSAPRTPTISAPGNRASTALTSGSARTPTSSSAWRASACALERGRTLLRRHHDHPGPAGPLLELARQVVDQRLCRTRLERDLEPAVLAAHKPHVALERSLDLQVALLGCKRNQPSNLSITSAGASAAAAAAGSAAGAACGAAACAIAARGPPRVRPRSGPEARRCGCVPPPGVAVPPPPLPCGAAPLPPLSQRADRLVGRRQVGRIGDAHQHHLGRRDRPARRLHLGDALEQHLPGARQHPHRQRGGERAAARAFGFAERDIVGDRRHDLHAGDEMGELGEVGQHHRRVGADSY